MSPRDHFDICIVGAGVVGLAVAYELARRHHGQDRSIVLLERESSFGQHTSSRNSEVIHAGIYYPPGSMKAKFCAPGKELLYAHCQQHDIPHNRIGKLIVAKKKESDALLRLKETAQANGVDDLYFIEGAELNKLEPDVEADIALLSPSTGIIDSHAYMQSLLHLSQLHGVQFSPYTRVERVTRHNDEFVVGCLIDEHRNPESYQFGCRQLINAAGLDAHGLAREIDGVPQASIPKVHYCKGDYFSYASASRFKHLIYPMPEANTVGLGIHATMDISMQLKFGPDVEYIDAIDYEVDAGKADYFASKIATYFPAIRAEDLAPAYSGIRPKLAGPGESAADYVIQSHREHGVHGLIQLFGMESPALTSSLAIAEYVASLLEE